MYGAGSIEHLFEYIKGSFCREFPHEFPHRPFDAPPPFVLSYPR
jgi:hypothetical protein